MDVPTTLEKALEADQCLDGIEERLWATQVKLSRLASESLALDAELNAVEAELQSAQVRLANLMLRMSPSEARTFATCRGTRRGPHLWAVEPVPPHDTKEEQHGSEGGVPDEPGIVKLPP